MLEALDMLRFLVVEDDVVSARLMLHNLSGIAHCDLARDGKSALELFTTALDSGSPYDAVFLDIMLPQVSGQDVLTTIRGLETAHGLDASQGVKIIITTALSDAQNMLDAHVAGCSAYIVKPIMQEQLTEVLKSAGLLND